MNQNCDASNRCPGSLILYAPNGWQSRLCPENHLAATIVSACVFSLAGIEALMMPQWFACSTILAKYSSFNLPPVVIGIHTEI